MEGSGVGPFCAGGSGKREWWREEGVMEGRGSNGGKRE